MLNRRTFLQSAAAASISVANAQTSWGTSVFDLHFHLRPTPEANAAHLDGAGIQKANLLARTGTLDRIHAIQEKYPGRYVWFAAADITKPDAEKVLTQAVKDGAGGLGEIKFHVAADGPELRRMYALAAELNVPILVHFQEVPHTPTEGVFSTGFKNFASVLKAYPKTTFIGHADAFWANISADYHNEAAYPTGPVRRGGVTDRLLGDFANLYGDMSAASGNNALSRDPEFTRDFLVRHQEKLLFGSDCVCSDGHGTGGQANNPAASRLLGKCTARETLTVLQRSATPELFQKLVWGNAHRVLKLNT